LSTKVTIIIPCIKVNTLTIKCINECLIQKKVNVNIIIITDIKYNKKISKKIKFFVDPKMNMSQKRNLGVKHARSEFIAFIDNDAYPMKDWLINAIRILNNKRIALVSGPDLPFENEKGWTKLIGEAHKSFLLSGSKVFRKNIVNKIECEQVSSCNMILTKKIFNKVNGMNEKIYIGEDIDFCNKIRSIAKKIIYSPKVKIRHKTRDLKNFFKQRFVYGFSIQNITKENFFNNFEFTVPLFFIIFTISVPAIAIFSKFALYIYVLTILITFLCCMLEGYRISRSVLNTLKLSLIFITSLILFGLGSLIKILNFKINLKKMYTAHSNK